MHIIYKHVDSYQAFEPPFSCSGLLPRREVYHWFTFPSNKATEETNVKKLEEFYSAEQNQDETSVKVG